MANWNSGFKWNSREDGFFWNGAEYKLVINLNEVLFSSEDISLELAKFILSDRFDKFNEAIAETALYRESEVFSTDDESDFNALFEVAEQLEILDAITALIVFATVADRLDIVDNIKELSTYLQSSDEFLFDENVSFDVFHKLLQDFGLDDVSAGLDAYIATRDKFDLLDKDPRAAISDFAIGVVGDYDNAYDWLYPFDLKIDWNSSTIQVMPDAELTTIEMPGIDGSIVEDTVYKDRLFQIVGFSAEGLTKNEKDALKTKITQILDSTKHTTKKLYAQTGDNVFEVKYEGQATISDGPSYIKATIPFRTGPYGKMLFQPTLEGSGLIYNEGDALCGVMNVISGPITNPSFELGSVTYRWNGTVPSGYNLVIDHDMLTCYLENSFGVKTNALANLTGEFQKIPAHTGVALTASSATESKIKTMWDNKVLW